MPFSASHVTRSSTTAYESQAIDWGYEKNLQLILEHRLENVGVEHIFSSFGESPVIRFIPESSRHITGEVSFQHAIFCIHPHSLEPIKKCTRQLVVTVTIWGK